MAGPVARWQQQRVDIDLYDDFIIERTADTELRVGEYTFNVSKFQVTQECETLRKLLIGSAVAVRASHKNLVSQAKLLTEQHQKRVADEEGWVHTGRQHNPQAMHAFLAFLYSGLYTPGLDNQPSGLPTWQWPASDVQLYNLADHMEYEGLKQQIEFQLRDELEKHHGKTLLALVDITFTIRANLQVDGPGLHRELARFLWSHQDIVFLTRSLPLRGFLKSQDELREQLVLLLGKETRCDACKKANLLSNVEWIGELERSLERVSRSVRTAGVQGFLRAFLEHGWAEKLDG